MHRRPRWLALTKQQRMTRARLGGYAAASKRDSAAIAAKATTAFLRRFLDEVDPDRTLPESERVRRAEAARKAYFVRLGFLSGKARAERQTSAERQRLAPWRAAEAEREADGQQPEAVVGHGLEADVERADDADDGQDGEPNPWLDGRFEGERSCSPAT